MHFQIIGSISEIETIATSSGIREIARLRKRAVVEEEGIAE